MAFTEELSDAAATSRAADARPGSTESRFQSNPSPEHREAQAPKTTFGLAKVLAARMSGQTEGDARDEMLGPRTFQVQLSLKQVALSFHFHSGSRINTNKEVLTTGLFLIDPITYGAVTHH